MKHACYKDNQIFVALFTKKTQCLDDFNRKRICLIYLKDRRFVAVKTLHVSVNLCPIVILRERLDLRYKHVMIKNLSHVSTRSLCASVLLWTNKA